MGNKYPEYIMLILRARFNLKENDHSRDDIFNEMQPNYVFSHVVAWYGLLGGYDNVIKVWIKDIYGIDIDEESEKRNE